MKGRVKMDSAEALCRAGEGGGGGGGGGGDRAGEDGVDPKGWKGRLDTPG